MNARPLKVAIDGRIPSHADIGGLASMLIGLVGGLGGLEDGDEEYVVLVYPGSQDWLRPYVGRNTRLHAVEPPGRTRLLDSVNTVLPWVRPFWRRLRDGGAVVRAFPPSDGTIEALGIEVMHFTTDAFRTALPNLYHPHDLQHIHLPHFFPRGEIAARNRMKECSARQASLVIAAATWTRADFIRHLDLPGDWVRVVPMGPPSDRYAMPDAAALADCRQRLSLPDGFALYPAAIWPHKNHLTLLDALALLRDRDGITVPFISTGSTGTPFFDTVMRRVAALGLEGHVRFLGFVPPGDLQCLYRHSTLTVIPTKFEAGSFPMWEAFLAGSPVAASTVTSLPDQAAGAALMFDPDDVGGMASAIGRLWTDPDLRASLARRGRDRVAQFSWDKTARHFRALYRQLGGRPLTDADRAILSADPLW